MEEGELSPSPEEPPPFLPGYPALQDYSKALVSQVVKATKASNQLPAEGDDFEYYSSFPGFKFFCDKMSGRINRMVTKLLRQQMLPSHWPTGEGSSAGGSSVGVEERFDALEEANDTLIERVSMLLDQASGITSAQQPVLPNNEVQRGSAEVASWNTKQSSLRGDAVNSYSFIHAKTVERPQLKFKQQVDNSSSPFIPLLRAKPNAKVPLPEVFEKLQNPVSLSAMIANTKEWLTSKHSKDFHPYQHELNTLKYTDAQLELREPETAGSLENTPLTFVTTLEQLEAVKNDIKSVTEFAVDLEHHSYRSYTGFVCLMQISTRCQDYLIDTLELRHHMNILLDPFTDPNIVKVLHGADYDIQWLQRDFGLYIVNMFDTGQASRTLGLPRHSLAFLLQYCCGVEANKQFQLADWRIRPLPQEMVKYAREDTHYLLYIYDRMCNELIRRSNERGSLLLTVLDNSRGLCAKPYTRPLHSEESYLKLYYKHKRQFNPQQLHCLQLLYKWRDNVARAEDESTGYILPNHMLFQISEIMPRDPQGVLACCNPIPNLLRQQVQEVNILVQKARNTPPSELLLSGSSVQQSGTEGFPGGRGSSEAVGQHVTIPPGGPPLSLTEPLLTGLKGETPAPNPKCRKILNSFTDIMSGFLKPVRMTKHEVLAIHYSAFKPPPVGESPLVEGKSLPATPTPDQKPEQEAIEYKKPNGKKKKLSVRGMDKGGDDSGPPVTKKRKKSADKQIKQEETTSFQYEGVDYTEYTQQGREVEPFNPHTRTHKDTKKVPKSKVHQKFSERSQSWKKGKNK